jgi:hypothetical protein
MQFKEILDWSEVWALLIPLAVLVKNGGHNEARPLMLYCIVALFINIAQDYIWKQKVFVPGTSRPGDNQFLYNGHAILRFWLISSYFLRLQPKQGQVLKTVVRYFFLFAVVLNFLFLQSVWVLSSRVMGLEAGFTILFCMLYFIQMLQDDEDTTAKAPAYWMITGITIYMIINFPIFLFYEPLANSFVNFAVGIWDIHNITYILLCLFMARYFYVLQRKLY